MKGCKHSFYHMSNDSSLKQCEHCWTEYRLDEGEWYEVRCHHCKAIRNEACQVGCRSIYDLPSSGTIIWERE